MTGQHDPATPVDSLADPQALLTFLNLADGPATVEDLARRTGLSSLEVAHHLGRMVEAGLATREHSSPGAGKAVQVLYTIKVEDIDLTSVVPEIRTRYTTELVLNKVKRDMLDVVRSGTAEDDSKLAYIQIRATPDILPLWKQKLKELGDAFKKEEDLEAGEESVVLLLMCYRIRG
jgi:DNA-binding transcriptional ArsR family regulator